MGKAGFSHLQQEGQRLQIYVKKDAVGEKGWELFRLLDLGDHIGASGYLFRTRTGELTVHVEEIVFLSKALLPLPEKWHGLTDVELRYRQRYVDLFMNPEVREVFLKRTKMIQSMRRTLESHGFIEVETPMMQPIAGGAVARPFVTHHNTLDMDLYLRIAPELYLKRLVVGGLDRVYEINRNFRNEGIDAIHQPEFTMLEFYQAYSDYSELMNLTEELFRGLVARICGRTRIRYGEDDIDFRSFARLSMREAICQFWPAGAGEAPTVAELGEPEGPSRVAERYNSFARSRSGDDIQNIVVLSAGELTGRLFEAVAEEHLIQPTFIYDFPTAISPLSKCREDDPSLTERFELFIAGMELANGFSELNDPEDQERRFRAQVEKGGQEAPKEVDEDYIRALSHGLPPTAGEGIGVDRLVMLLTDAHSIREVTLFPLLRPETVEEGTAGPPEVGRSAAFDPTSGKTK
jgi:lysyl-tRNA synthetase, class II